MYQNWNKAIYKYTRAYR